MGKTRMATRESGSGSWSPPVALLLAALLLGGVDPAIGALYDEVREARRLAGAGDPLSAERLLQAALRSAPRGASDRAPALFELAGLSTDPERARQLYEELIEDWPDTPEAAGARIEIARYHFAMGEYWGALEALRELAEKNPGPGASAAAFHLLGLTELALERPTRAAAAFADGLAAHPSPSQEAWLWIGAGDAAVAAGQPREAADAYRRAIDGPPAAAPVALFALARIEQAQGAAAAAAELYRRVAARSPGLYAQARLALDELRRAPTTPATAPDPPRPTADPPAQNRPADPPRARDSSADNSSADAPAPLPAAELGRWAVQVGAFAEMAKATALRSRLQLEGHEVELTTTQVGGKPLYKVLVGHHADRNEAYAAGLDLADATGLDFMPVRRTEP